MGTSCIIRLIKYYPVALNIYILVAMLLYVLTGADTLSRYAYTFIGQSFVVNALLWGLSLKFMFCYWHRLLIYNMSICLLLETLYNYNVKVGYYAYIIITLTMIALTASFIISLKHGKKDQENAHKNVEDAHFEHRGGIVR